MSLRTNQKIAISIVKGLLVHVLIGMIYMYSQPVACSRVASTSDCAKASHKVNLFAVLWQVKWIPAQLIWSDISSGEIASQQLVAIL